MTQQSLSATQRDLLDRLRRTNSDSPARPDPTPPRALAPGLASPLAPEPGTPADEAPLTLFQERMWHQQQQAPESSFLNLVMAAELTDVDPAVLTDRLNRLVERQDALRSVFPARDGAPVQRTVPMQPFEPQLVDLATGGDCGSEWDALVERTVSEPFDLATGPLYRAVIARVDPATIRLLVVLHHLVSDAVSLSVAARDLHSPPAEPLPLRLADYARWQRRQLHTGRWETDLAYWRQQLADRPPALELPADGVRPDSPAARGARHQRQLPPDLVDRVGQLARQLRTTPFVILLSAFVALLNRRTGAHDLVIGSTVLGRTLPETQQLVGLFTNKVALRVAADPDRSFTTLVAGVRAVVAEALAHEELPYELVLAELAEVVGGVRQPIFRLQFNMPGVDPVAAKLRAAAPVQGLGTVQDLHLMVLPDQQALQTLWLYPAGLFHASTVRTLADQYADLLSAALHRPDTPMREV